MNAVEIEEALSTLAAEPFDRAEFPYAFLAAFGNKETTLKRLRSGQSNASDIPEGVLQRSNIHIATCDEGLVGDTLKALRESPKTASAKAKYVLATDGVTLEAEDLAGGEHIAAPYAEFANHFGFFLPLAGISTVSEIKNNPIDVKATGRLNKLYVELLRENPDWAKPERRPDMNHFMARLIFCFFAEDTDIFNGEGLFTATVTKMSDRDGANTHEVIGAIFRAMNTPSNKDARTAAKTPNWADVFPYVNGGLFSGSTDVPRFTRTARSYLISTGELQWRQINPDIFGSMIQAVADDEERGALGMHYTSVPNILKVLNPLFLDDLRTQLDAAADNARMLLNLRKRMSKIRVFDPACGSGNFLVIAYKEMRAIEAEINRRRGEPDIKSEIPLTNFRGIELRHFPAEIARLALIIAEYQCDVLYRGQKEALKDFLPLDAQNWITCGNALRLDWLSVCPPTGTGVKYLADDLLSTPLDQPEIDFENEGGETFICGNPPYLGSKWQSPAQKADLQAILDSRLDGWRVLDYVAGWFVKAADFARQTISSAAFVATNSICQGQQASCLWPLVRRSGSAIHFAHTSFQWRNLASHNAGVTVVIVGITTSPPRLRKIYSSSGGDAPLVREAENINAYLVAGPDIVVEPRTSPLQALPEMVRGNSPTDGGHLLLEPHELSGLDLNFEERERYVRVFLGSRELINGLRRYCLWIEDGDVEAAMAIPSLRRRLDAVASFRAGSQKAATVRAASWPHRFDERKPISQGRQFYIPVISSENRAHLPIELVRPNVVPSNKVFTMNAADLWPFALVASRLNLVWVATVCARMRTDYSYTNTLGWNTFPVPVLTDGNKAELTRCAENILLAREAHFPKTIADLYDPDEMPDDLRRAHEENDEILERIYIGRRFRNDTERLEKLFDLYTKMIASQPQAKTKKKRSAA